MGKSSKADKFGVIKFAKAKNKFAKFEGGNKIKTKIKNKREMFEETELY